MPASGLRHRSTHCGETMRLQTIGLTTACAAAFVLGTAVLGTSGAQDAKAEPKPAQSPPSAAAKALEVLKADEGTWDVAMSFWFKPNTDPMRCHASLKAKMDLGGMFLEQRFEGAFGPEMGNKQFTSLSST